MTEYDYSPEAFEAYMAKQYKISSWVDKTNRSPQCNPFTPATPAVHAALVLREEEAARKEKRHRRRESEDRRRDEQSRSSRPKHHRSASSATATTPDHYRSRSSPQSLQYPAAYGSYQYPRDSKHSSQTSSSSRLLSPPHSAPLPRPLRSQTTPPNYGYQIAPQPVSPTGYPSASTPYLNVPQYPHSYYTPKPPPLIKRIFRSLTGGNKQQQQQPKPPQRKRSISF